jgi:uncharacterized protein YhaN
MNWYIEAFVHIAIWLILLCGAISLVVWSIISLCDRFSDRLDSWDQALMNRMGSAEWDVKNLTGKLDKLRDETKLYQQMQDESLKAVDAATADLLAACRIGKQTADELAERLTRLDRRQECLKQQLENLLVTINRTPEQLAMDAEVIRQAEEKLAKDAEVRHQADHLQIPAPETAGHFGIDWAEEQRKMHDAHSAGTRRGNSGSSDGRLPAPK